MTRTLARIAFLFSGIAGLTFEIVWMRHMGRAVGATTLAVATTTAAYMGGLALGSHLGGRLADRLRRPLAVYGAMELAIAVAGLAVPTLCAYVPLVDEALFAGITSGFGRGLVRFVVAAAVLIVPTTAMGMTLPILSRAVAERAGQVGRQVGGLYALNIAGAMIGAALAGFVWIPTFGLFATNLVAVGLDLLIGIGAILGGLLLVKKSEPTAKAAAAEPVLRPGSRQIVALLLVTGTAAMLLQVLWTRALGTALGPSTYAFTTIVCTYLAGLAIGGAFASWIADRVIATRLALSVVLAVTGVLTLAGIAVVDQLPLLLESVVLDEQLTMFGLIGSEFGIAALSVLPATIGMGAIFPLTLSAVVGSDSKIGAAVGRAYALNTIGNIAGSFAAAFILLPLLGVEWGMRVGAISYVIIALLLAWFVEPSVKPFTKRLLLAGAAIGLVLMFVVPSWDVPRWTSGMFRMSMTREWYPQGGFEASNLIFHADGLASTVTVEEEAGVRWIKVNGKIDGSSEGDMPTQILSGVLPLLLHPTSREVAVIGCGSGVTVGASLVAKPDHVTLIEIEKEVVEGAKLFEKVNHAPWNDPRVTVVEDDGRNFMMRGGPQYDTIISEPSNPWMTGAASLFTVEFFETAARRLQEDGVFLQWLQMYELAPERIGCMLKTFQHVFPHVLVFTPHGDSNDLLLVGKRTPWKLDRAALSARFEELRPELERASVHNLEDGLALLLFTEQEIGRLDPAIPLNTDDNAFIEFGAPRDLLAFAGADPEAPLVEETRGQHSAILRRLLSDADTDWPQQALRLGWGYLRQGMTEDSAATVSALAEGGATLPPELAAEALEVLEVGELLDEEDREIVLDGAAAKRDEQYAQVARLVQDGRHPAALTLMTKTPDLVRRSGAHALLHGFLLYRDSQYAAARRALLEAAKEEAMREHQGAITYYLAKSSYSAGEYARGVEEMTRYRRQTASLSLARSPE